MMHIRKLVNHFRFFPSQFLPPFPHPTPLSLSLFALRYDEPSDNFLSLFWFTMYTGTSSMILGYTHNTPHNTHTHNTRTHTHNTHTTHTTQRNATQGNATQR